MVNYLHELPQHECFLRSLQESPASVLAFVGCFPRPRPDAGLRVGVNTHFGAPMTSLICNVINRRPEIDNLSTLSHLLTHLHNDLSRNMSRHRMLHQLERQLGIRL
jgi:hypothetical protein